MKSNYALAIQGSPRKDGITSVMLEKAIAEAKKRDTPLKRLIFTNRTFITARAAEAAWTLENAYRRTICKSWWKL